jgi:hypothetical protein
MAPQAMPLENRTFLAAMKSGPFVMLASVKVKVGVHRGGFATGVRGGHTAERLRDSYAGRQLPLDERVSGRYLAVAETVLGSKDWPRAWAEDGKLRLDSAIDLVLGCDP